MTNKTITRADIAEELYRELGFSHADALKLIDKTLGFMTDAFGRGEEVKIAQFASFVPHQKHKRVGRNPRTGEQHDISARTVLSFRPSHFLKRALKQG
ncbi:MAG: integration host factor subunit alpha [Alphaproteobacteria bacterium]|nr:integration host factor subunit alpha [Alphaproteobacteria bacterium]